MKLLLEHCNDVLFLNDAYGKNKDTILHLVIWKDNNDWTPLHAACDKKKDVDELKKSILS